MDDFTDFADALAAQGEIGTVPAIRLMIFDLDVTLSSVDFQAFRLIVAEAKEEALWWSGETELSVTEMGLPKVAPYEASA